MSKARIKKFGIISLIALMLLIFVLSLVPTIVIEKENKNIIEEKLAEGSSYSGVLEIWNIDSFEGGTTSKEHYLELVAKEFEKTYSGAYVHITSLTLEGLICALEEGKRPDAFSFGSGIGEYIQKYVSELDNNYGVLDNFVSSGYFGGKLLAVPYCFGGYGLFSTTEKLTSAGKSNEIDLLEEIDNCGYTFLTSKKKERIVSSVSFGSNNFCSPEIVVSVSKNEKVSLKSSVSPYDAYAGFVGFSSSTILLGNHRDLARLVSKLELSQIEDLVFKSLGGYTDLVQYLSISAQDETKKNYAQKFLELALDDSMQSKLSEVGMFSPKGLRLYDGVSFYMAMEENFSESTLIPNAFETTEARELRKKQFIV